MYIPKQFLNQEEESIKEIIAGNSFAILVSEVDNRPWATHIPLLLETDKGGNRILTGHISKGNKQWRNFNLNKEVLAIFSGANAYISSSWYDHENVPTWNYEAVHVYGQLSIIEGEELKGSMAILVDKYEAGMKCPVSVEKMSEEFYNNEIKGVVGFKITITEIQAVSKLSQNRDEKNFEQIVEGLITEGTEGSEEIASIMKQKRN